MPFKEIPKDEQDAWQEKECMSREHLPPSMIVIQRPIIWVCPNCGHETRVYPTRMRCGVSAYMRPSRTQNHDPYI